MEENRIWHLVARKLSREITLEELRELEMLVRDDPAIAYRIDLYSRYYDEKQDPARTPDEIDHSWSLFLSKMPAGFLETTPPVAQSFQKRYRSKIIVGTLSLLFIAVVISWLVLLQVHPNAVAVVSPAKREMNTNPGTRTRLALADGTRVWLNSDSHLYYDADFGKTNREVTLSGEAFFDVVHNADLPMVVHARSVNILVKGTAFNVRGYPDAREVETSLLRGSIELTTNADPGRKILLKPNEKITIESTPDTVATTSPATKVVAQPRQPYFHIDILHQSAVSNTIPEVSWIQNKLVFDNEAFSEVMDKMEKWYNVKIEVKNHQLAARQVSGVFDKENISEALAALQLTIHFDFTIKGNNVFIK